MIRISLYRSLVLAACTGAVLALTGCNSSMAQHKTMKQEQYEHWNLTRVGVLAQLAQQQYEVGDYDKCRETLTQAFLLKIKFAPIYVLSGKLGIEKGALEPAANDLRAAIQIDPTKPDAYYLLGVIYQRWQKPEVAQDYYQQACDRAPNEAIYLMAVVEMKLTLGLDDDAQKLLEDKLVYFEQSAAIRVALAKIAMLKGNYNKAALYYREAVILSPDDMTVRRCYAEALFEAGRYADALPMLEDLHKREDINDQENLAVMLGQTYMQLHRPQDARNILQIVCRGQTNNIEAFSTLGEACIQTGDLSIAISAGRRVLKLEPNNVDAMIIVSLVQQKQKKWPDALATIEKAAKLAPQNSTVLCMLGVSLQQTGRADDAVAQFEKAVEVNPKDTWAQELLNSAKPLGKAEIDAP